MIKGVEMEVGGSQAASELLDSKVGPGVRRFMEQGFSQDFSKVCIDDSPLAFVANGILGTLAFTTGERIILGFPSYYLSHSQGLLVLAHELAHVTQSRLRKKVVIDEAHCLNLLEALEIEAAKAAVEVCSGRPGLCRVANTSGQILAWGEVGHFYTIYFVMLAAGADPKLSQRVAFFTQFPDEVEELDAATIGFRYFLSKASNSLALSGGAGGPRLVLPSEINRYLEADAALEDSLHIQRGLHALTGAPAKAETARRTKILQEINLLSPNFEFDFGLALHPFGDSFAHRDGDHMYKPPLGHGLHGHTPDTISSKRAKFYADYIEAVYSIAISKVPTGSRRLSQDETTSSLLQLCPVGSALNSPQRLQAAFIRDWSKAKMGQTMSDYNPLAYDVVPFVEFIKKPYSQLAGVKLNALERARNLSRKWAHL